MRRFQRLVTILCLGLLLVALIPTQPVQAATLTEAEAIELLRAYNVVRGDPSGRLDLDQKLTRAQAAAVFVRALGADQLAPALADLVPFHDAKGHWGAGEIALAERLGLMRGDGNGSFRPDSDITYAEVLTVLLRIVKKEPTGTWNKAAIMAEATRLELVPSGISADQAAIRGKLFWSLAVAVSTIPLPSGETALQTNLDRSPPTLTLAQSSVKTAEATVTITGTATDAAFVFVEGKSAQLNRTTGRFSYTASLAAGLTTLTVEAKDWAGNKASLEFSAERQGQVNSITIKGPAVVQTSTSTALEISVTDSTGAVLPRETVQATITGDIASFDLKTATLKTGSKTGRGTLTLSAGRVSKIFTFDVKGPSTRADKLVISSVNSGVVPSVGKQFTVTVQVVDADNRLVTDDHFRKVTLSSADIDGVSVSTSVVDTQAGVATFTVTGTRRGEGTLKAATAGLATVEVPVQVMSGTRIALSSTPASLTPDGTSRATIRATLQDENGRTIANTTSSDIQVRLTASSSDGFLADDILTIRRNTSSSSGDDASFQAGLYHSTARIIGSVISSHEYSVQTLFLPVTSGLPGTKLQMVVPSGNQTPGQAVTVSVRVLNAQNALVTTGSYAFQITVTTSNGEVPSPTLPEGLELTFANSDYYPVDDGKATTNAANDPFSVVGRTNQGVASLVLKYPRSGTVTLTPKLVGPNEAAYHPVTGFGAAAGSGQMDPILGRVTFVGAPSVVRLSVDSVLGQNQPGGAVAVGTTTPMIVRAKIVDSYGGLLGAYSGYGVLTRTSTGSGVTRFQSTTETSLRATITNGVAEWRILPSGTGTGYDVYTISVGSLPVERITLAVRNTKADPPTISAIRGSAGGIPSPEIGYVGPEAEFMEIQLAPANLPADQPNYWVTVKVFRSGQSAPIHTEAAVDLMQDPPVVRIPKSKLTAGRFTYEVTINNGAGDSLRSPDPGYGLNSAVNAEYNRDFRLLSGLFDADDGSLLLRTSGLVATGQVDVSKLTLVAGSHRISISAADMATPTVTSTTVLFPSSNLAALMSSDTDNGTVTIETQVGWFRTADDSKIAVASNTATLQPMPGITHVTLDERNKRLYLHGVGFQQGAVNVGQIKVGSVALRPGTTSTYDVVSTPSDTQITIVLSQATFDAIHALPGAEMTLTANTGWIKVTFNGTTFQSLPIATPHQVYIQVRVTSAPQYTPSNKSLTIRGSGFTGMTADPTKLMFRASGSSSDWHLDSQAVATVADDTTLVIQLSEANAGYFESTSGFKGKNVFMNTSPGWAVDAQGRPAGPLPTDSILFLVPR